uniref:Uncharacterized protein n=1 Tax=Avena sativa TaxID=4498 RepID=A0ACD5ZV37_AVESA
MAISLRTRWICRMRTNHARPWQGLDMRFSQTEMQVFEASTLMTVGDGATTLFWTDRWLDGKAIEGWAPALFSLIPKRARKRRTVREALLERCWITDIQGALSPLALWQYAQLWARLRVVELVEEPDTLRWMDDGCLLLCEVLL